MCSHRKDRGPLSETHIANNAVSNSIPIKKKETSPPSPRHEERAGFLGWSWRLMTISRITSAGTADFSGKIKALSDTTMAGLRMWRDSRRCWNKSQWGLKFTELHNETHASSRGHGFAIKACASSSVTLNSTKVSRHRLVEVLSWQLYSLIGADRIKVMISEGACDTDAENSALPSKWWMTF